MELSIQERLKDLRVERGLTLEQLAEKTHLSKSALGSYEGDNLKDISHYALIELAKFYDVTVDYLLGRSQTRNHPNADLADLHLSDDMIELLKSGLVDNSLLCELAQYDVSEEALEELDSLPCKDTPFLFANEDFATGFLNAEYLRCGKTFDRPYVAIDKLANIPFGYLMQRKAWNIPALVGFKTLRKQPLDEELQKLFALTACTFEALQTRCDVRCPEEFAKLYAAELCE